MDKTINKEAIIAEYLAGETSFRKLAAKLCLVVKVTSKLSLREKKSRSTASRLLRGKNKK